MKGKIMIGAFLLFTVLQLETETVSTNSEKSKVHIGFDDPRSFCGDFLKQTLFELCGPLYISNYIEDEIFGYDEDYGIVHEWSVINECCFEACTLQTLKEHYCKERRERRLYISIPVDPSD